MEAEKTEKMQTYDYDLISSKLRRWEKFLRQYSLPAWEELPDFGLYMDQVVVLLSKYLDFIPADEGGNTSITVSSVNNYVRLRVMPAPIKKKYYRIHLAYLLLICTLKQSLSLAYIQKMLPLCLTEAEVRAFYTTFIQQQKETSLAFIDQVRSAAAPILNGEGAFPDAEKLISTFTAYSNLSRLLALKLLNLQGQTETQESE